jgi:hypothetical protein
MSMIASVPKTAPSIWSRLRRLFFGAAPEPGVRRLLAYCQDDGSIILSSDDVPPTVEAAPIPAITNDQFADVDRSNDARSTFLASAEMPSDEIGKIVRRALASCAATSTVRSTEGDNRSRSERSNGSTRNGQMNQVGSRRRLTLACEIAVEKGGAAFTPAREISLREDERHFQAMPGSRVEVSARCSDAELGEALLKTFEACE